MAVDAAIVAAACAARIAVAMRIALLLAAVLVCGCANVRPWLNAPIAVDRSVEVQAAANRDPSTLVALTLSGGGARAAAFGLGVLQELRDTPCCWNSKGSNLLDAVDLVSGVSGGSIVAAYFAAFGSGELDRFEREFLRFDFQSSLVEQLRTPANLAKLTSPWYGRSHLLADRLDALYRGMTFGDVGRRPRHPQLVVTATDLSLGTGFDFTADQFALICSDLQSVPLSFAVAASSSVPLLLSPMTLKNWNGDCPLPPRPSAPLASGADYRARLFAEQQTSYADASARPWIHLVDGGLADNLGVRRLMDRALSGGGMRAAFKEVRIPPGSIRRLVVIAVNAERDPSERIERRDTLPSTLDVVDALLFGAGARATHETEEMLDDIARAWQTSLAAGGEAVRAFAPGAELHLVKVNLRDAPPGEQRLRLLQVPTSFTIAPAEVDSLIGAGREILRSSPAFARLRGSMGEPPPR